MPTVSVNEQNFSNEVTAAGVPVLADFYASWCMPCRMLAPVLESLSTELDGQVKFVSIDVDEQPELAERYHIQSIPTMVVFRKGSVTDKLVGAVGKEQLRELLSACEKTPASRSFSASS